MNVGGTVVRRMQLGGALPSSRHHGRSHAKTWPHHLTVNGPAANRQPINLSTVTRQRNPPQPTPHIDRLI